MTTRQWKALVALSASALIAVSMAAGCGGSGNTTIANTNGGAGGTDAGASGGSSGTGGSVDGGGGQSEASPCSGTEQLCGGSCANTQADNNNCGSCGNACSGGSVCQNGQCVCAQQGQQLCGNSCVDTQTDPANCGSCGNPCSTAQVCSSGKCTTSCGSGQTDCSGACVDTQTDNSNCGACGTACSGGSSCQGGACTCPNNETLCGSGSSATCVDTQTDSNNCGKCGTVCSGGQACSSGSCGCPSNETSCSGTCVDTQTDVNNCGKCATACTTGQVCSKGTCSTNCASGTTNCSGSCVDTNTDKNNCGGCNQPCTATNQTCVGGSCTCPSGQQVCSGACTDTQTDGSNCGKCGTACTGGMTCQTGSCKCPTGQTDCSGTCIDVNGTDSNNCGGCGTKCPSNSTCQSGSCKCGSGLSMCSKTCVDEQTDNNNCGACGKACTNGASCVKGSCSKAAVCGDGTIDTGEECDDGNTSNLDGCDKSCNYEVFTRMDTVAIQGGGSTTAPSYCAHTTNALGNAISNIGLNGLAFLGISGLNDTLKSDIDAGTTNIIVQALGLDDLTGVSDSSLELGATSGKPDPKKGTWPGSSQLDWWYLLDHTTLDANDIPTSLITPAAIANRALTAGPSKIDLLLNLGGSPALLEMLNSKVHATVGTTTSIPAPPPNQLATGLKVFETLDGTGSSQGLCGDVTVESLAQIPIPQSLAQGGSTACAAASSCSNSHQYTYCGKGNAVGTNCNSLLDAIVGGCKATACVTAITPTQPDVAGSGAGTLSLGTNNKVKQTTTGDTNAYSSWMTFHAQRVHATGKF